VIELSESHQDTLRVAHAGPFAWVRPEDRERVLVALFALTAVLSLWLSLLGAPLTTAAAPHGIVSFELARTAGAAHAILDSWDEAARESAMLVQGVDFLYLLAYPAFYSLMAFWLGVRMGGRWRSVASPLAWLALVASPLDAIENLALIHQLQLGPSDGAAFVAWAHAVPKFAIVAVLSSFVLVGLAALSVRAAQGRRGRPR
jgi:hypothetical protein